MNTFGDHIRELRLAARMTQDEVAKRVGVAVSYVSKIENGRLPPPSREVIEKLAPVLGETADELLLSANRPGVLLDRILEADPAKKPQVRDFLNGLMRKKPARER